HVAEREGVGAVDRERAVVDDVADDRSAGAAVAELQRGSADGGAAGIGVGTGVGDGGTALDRHSATSADAAGIGPGEALVEDQLGIVGDGRALQAVGIADQRAAADVPVLGASAGQGPDRGADLVEDGKPAVLLRRTDSADIEGAEQRSRDYRVAELEGVAPGPEHIAVDGETGSERERKRTAGEVDGGAAAIDRALVEDAAGSGHVDRAVDHPEVDDRALRVAGDGQALIAVASARVLIELAPSPETVAPLLSVPALLIVFFLPVTLKVWFIVAPL